jgi:hypothetical protein
MNFVIICSQRTGSTLLTQLLDQRDDILCNGAIFEARPGRLPVRWAKDAASVEELGHLRDNQPEAFLRRVFAENRDGQHVGFKICSGHNDAMLDKLVLDKSIGKIVLMRQNVLAVYSSAMIARGSGERRATATTATAEDRPVVEFNAKKFMRFWERYSGYYRGIFGTLNDTRQNFHMIHYTEINDPLYFGRLLNFIGADPSRTASEVKNKKQNSPDILSRFSNREETMTFLNQRDLQGWCFESETTLDPATTA